VPLIVGSERVGDVSGASIADLGPGSALLEDEGGEPPGTPFARVRPHTSCTLKACVDDICLFNKVLTGWRPQWRKKEMGKYRAEENEVKWGSEEEGNGEI